MKSNIEKGEEIAIKAVPFTKPTSGKRINEFQGRRHYN